MSVCPPNFFVFCTVCFVSEESRQLALPRTYCYNIVLQHSNVLVNLQGQFRRCKFFVLFVGWWYAMLACIIDVSSSTCFDLIRSSFVRKIVYVLVLVLTALYCF
jgi:hypothetical protein